MRIATWNLQSDKPLTAAREAALRRAIDTIAADVWVLTETWVGFSPGPNYECAAESTPAPDLVDQPDRRWVAIWSRLPARRLNVTSEADRMAATRIESSGGKGMVIVGTVLPWRADQRLAPVTGAAAFCAAMRIQSAEWTRLRGDQVKDCLCVAGDFNQELQGPLRTGTRDGLRTILAEFERMGLKSLTGGLVTDDTGPPMIDHICIAGGVRPTLDPPAASWTVPTFGTPGSLATDHVGAFADLEYRPTAAQD